jgi:hypothetical protein
VVTELLREAWGRYALARGLKKFEMAGARIAFYFDLDSLANPNVSFMSVDGTKTHRALMGYKTSKAGTERHWHFAVSAKPAVHPQPMLQVRAHVLFSDDGRTIAVPNPSSLTVSDHDALLQLTFDRVPVADRGQAYWLVWRQLEDARQDIVEAYGPRVLAFWGSRLDYLERMPDNAARREESKLLGWLILAGRLPPAEALPLARRTATLSHGELPVSNHFWDIADRYVAADPPEALDLIAHVIGAEVRDPFDVLPSDRVSTALRTILDSDSVAARERATRLIHRLGEQGYEQFGDLLK